MTTPKYKAAFIDRDGTLIEEVNFLSRVEDMEIFPFTEQSLRLLKDDGYLIIVVTNQSGIGRGLYSEADMHAIHDAMQNELGGIIDEFHFCPHLPDSGCACRKPNGGMLYSEKGDVDPERSWVIGDKPLDVQTGINAGIRTAMVMTGYGRGAIDSMDVKPDVVADDLIDAVKQILDRSDSGA